MVTNPGARPSPLVKGSGTRGQGRGQEGSARLWSLGHVSLLVAGPSRLFEKCYLEGSKEEETSPREGRGLGARAAGRVCLRSRPPGSTGPTSDPCAPYPDPQLIPAPTSHPSLGDPLRAPLQQHQRGQAARLQLCCVGRGSPHPLFLCLSSGVITLPPPTVVVRLR